MNNEEFNDAMCRLRQAEENFNKALQDVRSAINEDYRKNSSIDEAYNKGLQDLYDACCILAKPVPDMHTIFGSSVMDKIILNYSPQDIIDKVNQWKADKKQEAQELHVGDEIEYMYPGREPEKCIVIGLDNGIADEKIIWTIGLDLSQRTWFSSASYYGDSYRKTGKHYDAIPFPKEIRL